MRDLYIIMGELARVLEDNQVSHDAFLGLPPESIQKLKYHLSAGVDWVMPSPDSTFDIRINGLDVRAVKPVWRKL